MDVFPDRSRWQALTSWRPAAEDLPEGAPVEVKNAAGIYAPFAMFTATMTEGTIATALEVGNRISWSTRYVGLRDQPYPMVPGNVVRPLLERLGIAGRPPPSRHHPRFAESAQQFRAEIATQPSPSVIIGRLEAAIAS